MRTMTRTEESTVVANSVAPTLLLAFGLALRVLYATRCAGRVQPGGL